MGAIREARAGEAEAITALMRRSKAHWGYDEAFMAAAAADLRVDEDDLARMDVVVAEDEGGALVGAAGVDPAHDPPLLDLLFVVPEAIGTGLGGRLLRTALDRAAARGVPELEIESDPNAEPFYLAQGARRIGGRPSPSTGRVLPLLRIPTAGP